MRNLKTWMLTILGIGMVSMAFAHIDPTKLEEGAPAIQDNNTVDFRSNCDPALLQIDMSVNNVRARMTTGGDWGWDGNDARYIVPKVPAGVPEVSSIFAGAVWLGGVDPGGNLKVAAQTYGRAGGNFDFWPGPLDPVTGETEQAICSQWDRFFVVTGEEIDEHLRNYNKAVSDGVPYDPALIPKGVRGWPGRGNEFFFDINGFELPNTSQGLAGFFDENGDGLYTPDQGDYPIIEIRGCPTPQYADEMIFWIYNDAGNIHAESEGDVINMEIQVQAFAYATNDEINDMTFQRYKLINRAIESIDSTHFAYWVDADLGCYTDDYIGCDTLRSLAFTYNQDAADGTTGCDCDQGVNTYCTEIPIIGMDYFRGPLDELGKEIGMSSFTYINNAGVDPTPPPGTTDPNNAQEYFNYLTGSWRDGNPFTFGDDAYQDGEPIKYAFPDAPNSNGWSMCSGNLPAGDRRTVQASGPFRLDPGAINELIIGIVWVADQTYPCPSIAKLQEADDIAQALFDNCFILPDGPDAPDVDFVELDQEIIAVFTNDTITSNNAFEQYSERGLQIPPLTTDSVYRFEGYKLYQLADPTVTLADINDVDKARLIFQVDIKNGVSKIFNWSVVESNIEGFEVYTPNLEVEGADDGIRHTFRITEDQFAEGDRRLINHKKYYFTALAYAYNEYAPFDPREILGQRQPYLEGRRNIGDGTNPFYTTIPRPIVDRNLNSAFGEGAIITRIDGIGNGGLFLDLSDESRAAIEESFATGGDFGGEITYRPGRGPIEVAIFNPLDVVDGEFELTFVDSDLSNDELETGGGWTLRNLTDPSAAVIRSEKSIDNLNEQIIKEFGFTVSIGQTADAGARVDDANGNIGYEEEYANENAIPWLSGIPDGLRPDESFFSDFIFDYVVTGPGQEDEVLDPVPSVGLSSFGPGYFVPYGLTSVDAKSDVDPPFITPAWASSDNGHDIVRNQADLADLNNVDIVLTSDKSLWSRCVIVETANRFYEDGGLQTEGNAKMMDLRGSPNVTQFAGSDGLPAVDTEDPGNGMGWFPGYAVDVETGQRLNIFFGENSTYDGAIVPENYTSTPTGRDMMFNPSSQVILNAGFGSVYNYMAGAQHFIYVTKTPYDECALFRERLDGSGSSLRKVRALREVTWAGFLLPLVGESFLPYGEGNTGLIPEDVTIKLRVDNPYSVELGTGEFNGYPTYRFKLEGKQATELDAVEVENALDMINVVPNPYYGYSAYETSQFDNLVRITNLPAKCVITIYSLDGKFIRQYNRDERGAVPVGNNRALTRGQFVDFQEWDLRNNKGIPVASGVYLIHVDAEGLGERVIKWFGVGRQFDPSGL